MGRVEIGLPGAGGGMEWVKLGERRVTASADPFLTIPSEMTVLLIRVYGTAASYNNSNMIICISDNSNTQSIQLTGSMALDETRLLFIAARNFNSGTTYWGQFSTYGGNTTRPDTIAVSNGTVDLTQEVWGLKFKL